MPPRILVMVLAADHEGYWSLISAIRETWGKQSSDDFRILYYYGRRQGDQPAPDGTVEIRDDILVCLGWEENYNNILAKTIDSFNYVYQHLDFDYVFRCCAGSYVLKRPMVDFLLNKPRERFYCGVPVEGPPYASGAGFFLSKDLIGFVAQEKQKLLAYGAPWDDMALGRLMRENAIPNHPGASMADNTLDAAPSTYHYHFKKKVDWMHELHKRHKESMHLSE